jgi:hypothetical protein
LKTPWNEGLQPSEIDIQQGKFKILWLLSLVLQLMFWKKWFFQLCPKVPSFIQKPQGILGVKNTIDDGSLTPKGPKTIFKPFLKFGQAIVKAIYIKNS